MNRKPWNILFKKDKQVYNNCIYLWKNLNRYANKMGMEKSRSNDSDQILVNEFKILCDRLHVFLSEFEIETVPYSSPHVPMFAEKNSDLKLHILSRLTKYIQSIEGTVLNGSTPKNNSDCLWQAMKVFQFKCPPDFFSKLNDDDIIEVYDLNNVQFWRNINFFPICSYTLEHIFTEAWTDRYHREPEASKNCYDAVMRCLRGSFTTTLESIPKHIVRENHSSLLLDIEVFHKYLAPIQLKGSHQYDGYIVVSNAQAVRANKDHYVDVSSEFVTKKIANLSLVDGSI